MQQITATELRTKSKDLFETLKRGQSVDLIRKSKIIGRVIPERETQFKVIDAEKLERKIQNLEFPRLTMKEIDRRYRAAMMKKHGKGISRR